MSGAHVGGVVGDDPGPGAQGVTAFQRLGCGDVGIARECASAPPSIFFLSSSGASGCDSAGGSVVRGSWRYGAMSRKSVQLHGGRSSWRGPSNATDQLVAAFHCRPGARVFTRADHAQDSAGRVLYRGRDHRAYPATTRMSLKDLLYPLLAALC